MNSLAHFLVQAHLFVFDDDGGAVDDDDDDDGVVLIMNDDDEVSFFDSFHLSSK